VILSSFHLHRLTREKKNYVNIVFKRAELDGPSLKKRRKKEKVRLHGENILRQLPQQNVASANKNCSSDNFNCYKYSCRQVKLSP